MVKFLVKVHNSDTRCWMSMVNHYKICIWKRYDIHLKLGHGHFHVMHERPILSFLILLKFLIKVNNLILDFGVNDISSIDV